MIKSILAALDDLAGLAAFIVIHFAWVPAFAALGTIIWHQYAQFWS